MIYRSRSRYSRVPGGYLCFRGSDKTSVYGYGEGDCIRLQDEFGRAWIGSAHRDEDSKIVRYRFRDASGRNISGMSDSHGIVLRDDKGRTWRGFID
jgi:hypothetical protein